MSISSVSGGMVVLEFEVRVQGIVPRTYDVKSFRFDRPSSFNYRPGQFMFVTLNVGEQKMRKPLTISSSPTEKDYIEFTKKLTGHPFSNALDTLKVGDGLSLDAPYGNFTFAGQYSRVALLAGGMGITPMRSICRYYMDSNLQTRITLLYGCNTEADIVFRNELEDIQRYKNNFKLVITLTEAESNWKGYVGRINNEMIRSEIPDYQRTIFYSCGPPAMVGAMSNLLKSLGVAEENVKVENFEGY